MDQKDKRPKPTVITELTATQALPRDRPWRAKLLSPSPMTPGPVPNALSSKGCVQAWVCAGPSLSFSHPQPVPYRPLQEAVQAAPEVVSSCVAHPASGALWWEPLEAGPPLDPQPPGPLARA